MRVSIDRATCTGYANCVEAAGEVFALGPDDVALVLVGVVSEDDEERVRRAARLCPVNAVLIEE